MEIYHTLTGRIRMSSTLQNPYYDRLKPLIEIALDATADGKITLGEIWTFLAALSEAIQVILQEANELSDEDLNALKEAATKLYDDYVEPLDLPGPDFLIDPLLRNGLLPGLVDGAFKLARRKLMLRQQADESNDS